MKNKRYYISFLKYFLFLLVSFCLIQGLKAQPKKIAFSAAWAYHDEEVLPGITRYVGNVVFSQDKIIGYCDSAYHYEKENYLEAFGESVRVHINDSVTLYGKFVVYDGNEKTASISRDVILMDNTSALYTDSLIYDIKNDVGYYLTGGKMINKDNTLTSIIGRYHTKNHKVVLNKDVLLVNKTYTMDCDSLAFNTESEIVYFISRTHLVSDENTIYTNSGWYDTKKDISLLIDDVKLENKNQRIVGDSLYYDKNLGYGLGWNNIIISDSIKNYIVKGNFAEYFEHGGLSTVTDSTLLILIDQGDSLYLHSDTLKIMIDSLQDPQLIIAFNKVKFYRGDLQGACDSLAYLVPDSILNMYYNPVIWSGGYQLTADTIRFTILDSANLILKLCKAAFIVSSLYDNTEFNQIKGANIFGYFHNKELIKVDVINNAECLYYIQEEDSSLIGINSSATSEMTIFFKEGEIDGIAFYNSPDGKINPDESMEKKDRFLKEFRWLENFRPNSFRAIYHTPMPRFNLKEPDAEQSSDKDR